MGVVERLHAELAAGPIAAALAARDAVAADADVAASIVDNSDLEPSVRVAALLALALVAQDGARVPDLALAALEDDVLLDAVLASGAASALTGLACAAGDRISDGLRRYLALRIRVAGATGMHVAALYLRVGEVDAAVAAAVPVIAESVRGNAADEPVVLALAMIVADWSRERPGIAERIAAELASEPRATFERALRAVEDR